jgi:hypothetical protein
MDLNSPSGCEEIPKILPGVEYQPFILNPIVLSINKYINKRCSGNGTFILKISFSNYFVWVAYPGCRSILRATQTLGAGIENCKIVRRDLKVILELIRKWNDCHKLLIFCILGLIEIIIKPVIRSS